MSYEPNTWATGDVITADKLNHIEQGISGVVFHITAQDNTLDATYSEVKAALDAGRICIVKKSGESTIQLVVSCYAIDSDYYVTTENSTNYIADSLDGYPIAVL